MQILINVLLATYVVDALLMVLLILMQRPKSEGLGAAFGGGVTENIFGAQTTNVLVKFTVWLAGIFFALTFALSVLYAHKATRDTGLRRELLKQQTAPVASPAGSPAQSATSPVPAGSPAASAPVAASASPAASSKPKP
jgi:preprotein translocase subunit SecG